MKKNRSGIIILLLIIIGLFLTKPSTENFDNYIDKKYSREKSNEKTELQRIVNSGVNKTLAFQIKQTKEYKNYYIFSMVDALEVDKEVKFVGILGIWFSVN
jgi:uncharacterized protein YxeA